MPRRMKVCIALFIVIIFLAKKRNLSTGWYVYGLYH